MPEVTMRLLIEAILIAFIGGMAAHILLVEDERDEYRFYWQECWEELEEVSGDGGRLLPP